jgi:hypothetical protein
LKAQTCVHLYFALKRDEQGYPPFSTEELDAVRLEDGTYRIEGIPVFAKDLARLDIVRVVRVVGDDRLWIAEGLESPGHGTARLARVRRTDETLSELTAKGLKCIAAHGLIAIDIPAGGESCVSVLETIVAGEERGDWEVEISVAPSVLPLDQYADFLSRIERARAPG